MGSFANTVFSILLGWLQGLISIIWSALTDKGGESFFQFIGDNWIKITLILCAVGLIADFAVYFFRWAPYKVWRTFWRHLKGRKDGTNERNSDRETAPAFPGRREYAPADCFTDPDEETVYREEPRSYRTAYVDTEEPDELQRWRDGEPETVEPDIPAEITKAGYSVPADSPYRNPDSRGRRRRFRVSLLGDSRDEGEIHYFAPRPMIDKKDAYNAPVSPEKWTGSREEDS